MDVEVWLQVCLLSALVSVSWCLSFTEPRYEASVQEEQSELPLDILRVATEPVSHELRYRMESLLDARSQDFFEIDERSGWIRAVSRLDREFMDQHFFKVSVDNHDLSATVEIRVLDVNDHSPLFELNAYNFSVHESVAVGTALATLNAKDADTGDNGRVTYAILEQNTEKTSLPFVIDQLTGVLALRSPLDRELEDKYTFTVSATDDGLSRMSSNVSVEIEVVDDNDNHPVFLSDNHTFCVPEDLRWQDRPLVGSIRAEDKDQGSNSVLRYSIIGGNVDHTFEMDVDNGNLRLVRQLDRENIDKYTLIVRAQDQGRTPKSNTTQVVVEVDDVNDNAPRFPTAIYYQSVVENVADGYSVLQLHAFDPDTGDNARINYRMADLVNEKDDNGDLEDALPFLIERETGWIVTRGPLDREKAPRFKFLVEAFDNGNPSLSTSIPVTVSVHDANDNDPVFERKEYTVSVSEVVPVGSVVIKLRAFDHDADNADRSSTSGHLRYEIVGGNSRNRFTISTIEDVGVVSVAQPLNGVQEGNAYLISVHAVDEGGRFGSCLIHVKVEDANDHVPRFENTPYFVDVFEDVVIDSTILMLHAQDDDMGENARISYHLLGQNEFFDVDKESGALRVVSKLDREKQATFILTVQAKDSGQPPLADVTEIEISVLDTNDNWPVFVRSSYEGSLAENAARGTKVLRVHATDADADELGEVRYFLDQMDVSSKAFTIDSISGDIRSNGQLDRESKAVYELVVVAKDGGLPPKTSKVNVVIRLIDVNDNPPVFVNSSMSFELDENDEHGARIGEIRVNDPDIGDHAKISFQLLDSSDSRFFYLSDFDEKGGIWLFAKRSFDFEDEEKNLFRIAVRAESTPLRTDADIVVRIRDVNDNVPVISDSHFIINCRSERASCSRDLGRIPAFDPDPTDLLKFSFSYGNNAKLLHLDESSGHLRLASDASNVNLRAEMGVVVSDGLNKAEAVVMVELNYVTQEALANSIQINLELKKSSNSSNFLDPTLLYLRKALASVLQCKQSDVVVFGLRLSDIYANVTLYVLEKERIRPALWLQQRIYVHAELLDQLVGNGWTLVGLDDEDICVKEPCLNFEVCRVKPKFGGKHVLFKGATVTLRVIDSLRTYACHCPKGFTGMNTRYTCDKKINLCYSNPCSNGATCLATEDDYVCSCKENFTGRNCHIPLEKKSDDVDDVDDDDVEVCAARLAACVNSRDGDCGHIAHEGLMEDASASAEKEEHQVCRSRSFSGRSYVALSPLRGRVTFSLTFELATGHRVQRRSLLLYNGRLNDRNDFIALTLDSEEGLKLTFSPGGQLLHSLSIPVGNGPDLTDGAFHRVKVVFDQHQVLLVVGNCDEQLALRALDSNQVELRAELRCANRTSSPISGARSNSNQHSNCGTFLNHCPRFLDLNGPLLLAGAPDGSSISIDKWTFFEGCVRRLALDNSEIDMEDVIKNNGSVLGCPAKREHFCSKRPCMNDGVCRETWAGFTCRCGDKWSGKDCSLPSSLDVYGIGGDESVLQLTKPNLQPLAFPWVHAVAFRTASKNAGLMDVHLGNAHSVLSIEEGKVVYTLRDVRIVMDAPKVDDEEWHHVSVKWMTDEIWLNVDFGQSEATQTFLNAFGGTIVRKVVMATNQFRGCIKDVEVGNEGDRGPMEVLVEENLLTCDLIHQENLQRIHDSRVEECDLKSTINDTCLPLCTLKPCLGDRAVCQNVRISTSNRTSDNGMMADRPKWDYKCVCGSDDESGQYCQSSATESSCPRHWWGSPTCGPCDCDSSRGFNETCDALTGHCHCKAFHYEVNVNTTSATSARLCRPCNCYPLGSRSSDCDLRTGQCECKTGVSGRRCEACAHKFAELTSHGCQVVYNACPAEYADNLWWERSNLGSVKKAKCPGKSVGSVTRNCTLNNGWSDQPDFSDCTHRVFLRLRSILNQAHDQMDESNKSNLSSVSGVIVESGSDSSESWSQLSKVVEVVDEHTEDIEAQRLRGDALHEVFSKDLTLVFQTLRNILEREMRLSGFQLAHRKDRLFLPNLVKVASWLLERSERLVSRMQLVLLISNYGQTLMDAMQDTFTTPFELVGKHITLGLDTLEKSNRLRRETREVFNYFPKYTNFARSEGSWSRVRVRTTSMSSLSIVQYLVIGQPTKKLVDREHVMIPQLRLDTRITSFSDVIAFKTNLEKEHVVQFAHDVQTSNLVKTHHCVQWESELRVWSSLYCDTLHTRSTALTTIVSCVCVNNEENKKEKTTSMVQAVIEETLGSGTIFVDDKTDKLMLTLAVLLSTLLLTLTLICLLCCHRALTNTLCIARHLTVNLLVFNLIFGLSVLFNPELTATEESVMHDSHLVCRGIALVLHFTGCSLFSWLLVRTLHFWRTLTELRDIDSGARMPFYSFVGLGVPAATVLLTVGVSGRNYAAETRFCFVSITSNVVTALGLLAPILCCAATALAITVSNVRTCTMAVIKMEAEELRQLRLYVYVDLLLLPLLVTHHLLAITFVNGLVRSVWPMLIILVVSALLFLIGLVLIDLNRHRRPRRPPPRPRDLGNPGPGLETLPMSTGKSALIYRQSGGNLSTTRGRELRDFEAGLSLASTTSRSSFPMRLRRSKKVVSDDETETDLDQRSFELASSHSSDDENDTNAVASSNGGNSSARTLAVHDYPQY